LETNVNNVNNSLVVMVGNYFDYPHSFPDLVNRHGDGYLFKSVSVCQGAMVGYCRVRRLVGRGTELLVWGVTAADGGLVTGGAGG